MIKKDIIKIPKNEKEFVKYYIQRKVPERFDTPILNYISKNWKDLIPIKKRKNNITFIYFDEENLDLLKIAEKNLNYKFQKVKLEEVEQEFSKHILIDKIHKIVIKPELDLSKKSFMKTDDKELFKLYVPYSKSLRLKDFILLTILNKISSNGILAKYKDEEGEICIRITKPIGILGTKNKIYYIEEYIGSSASRSEIYQKHLNTFKELCLALFESVFDLNMNDIDEEELIRCLRFGIINQEDIDDFLFSINLDYNLYDALFYMPIFHLIYYIYLNLNPITLTLRKIGIEHNDSFKYFPYIHDSKSFYILDLKFSTVGFYDQKRKKVIPIKENYVLDSQKVINRFEYLLYLQTTSDYFSYMLKPDEKIEEKIKNKSRFLKQIRNDEKKLYQNFQKMIKNYLRRIKYQLKIIKF